MGRDPALTGPARRGVRVARAATRLTLICHASTPAIRAASFPVDEPLDERGWRTARAAARPTGGPNRCWTSPAAAARQTAEALGLDAAPDVLLRDADYGRWAGRTLADLAASEPEALAAWLGDPDAAPHGGETVSGLIRRIGGWLDGQRAQPGRACAMTHAAVIRAALVHAIGAGPHAFWHLDVAPLGRLVLSSDGRRWTLSSFGAGRR